MAAKLTLSRISLISSIPLLLAASNSIMSNKVLAFADMHMVQELHGSPSESAKQLAAFASIRAVVVLPVPLGPQNIYA